MAKRKEKPGVMLYWETFDTLEKAKGDKLRILLKAIRNFAQYGEVPDFEDDEALDMVWPSIQSKLIKDEENYQNVVKVRQEAGRKGGQARANNLKQKQANEANATSDKQIKPTTTTTATTSTTATTNNKGNNVTMRDNGFSPAEEKPTPTKTGNYYYDRAVAAGHIDPNKDYSKVMKKNDV